MSNSKSLEAKEHGDKMTEHNVEQDQDSTEETILTRVKYWVIRTMGQVVEEPRQCKAK